MARVKHWLAHCGYGPLPLTGLTEHNNPYSRGFYKMNVDFKYLVLSLNDGKQYSGLLHCHEVESLKS